MCTINHAVHSSNAISCFFPFKCLCACSWVRTRSAVPNTISSFVVVLFLTRKINCQSHNKTGFWMRLGTMWLNWSVYCRILSSAFPLRSTWTPRNGNTGSAVTSQSPSLLSYPVSGRLSVRINSKRWSSFVASALIALTSPFATSLPLAWRATILSIPELLQFKKFLTIVHPRSPSFSCSALVLIRLKFCSASLMRKVSRSMLYRSVKARARKLSNF